ncbi:MAG: hypothetical protein CMF01_16490 [Hyphomonas sp.]|nr:hypothetical protein [Hyphomonas sp.]
MGFWGWVILVLFILFVIGSILVGWAEATENAETAKKNGIRQDLLLKHGAPNVQMVCPHCQTKGKVLTKPIKKKAGISGAKATGAILTGGVSLVATGLSRKDAVTEAHCANCSSTWHF